MTSHQFTTRCVPGDIEVLTEAGWRRGTDLRNGERVATWDPVSGDIVLEPVDHVEVGHYDGTIISLVGAAGSATGNPGAGVWVRTPIGGDTERWTHWHRRPLPDLTDLPRARIPIAGHHSGPGLRNDAGDYAGVLGWVSVEAGYHGTSIQIGPTESNHHRASATAARLAALGAHAKRIHARGGAGVDAWFLPGPLTASIRRDLIGGMIRWPAVWKMTSVELNAFVDGAVGGRRRTLHAVDRDAVDLMQAIGAITGHRTTAHDVGRRAGGTLDLSIGVEASISHDAIKRRIDTWDGTAFALATRSGGVVARRGWRVFVSAT